MVVAAVVVVAVVAVVVALVVVAVIVIFPFFTISNICFKAILFVIRISEIGK